MNPGGRRESPVQKRTAPNSTDYFPRGVRVSLFPQLLNGLIENVAVHQFASLVAN